MSEVRDHLAVRRPRRPDLGRPTRVRQVANVALLGWNGEDLATRLDRRTLAGCRKREVRHAIRDVLPLWHHPREIARRRDVHDTIALRAGIDLVDVTSLLEHEDAGAGVEGLHVEVAVVRDLAELLRARVVAPHVGDAIAIREEIHDVA